MISQMEDYKGIDPMHIRFGAGIRYKIYTKLSIEISEQEQKILVISYCICNNNDEPMRECHIKTMDMTGAVKAGIVTFDVERLHGFDIRIKDFTIGVLCDRGSIVYQIKLAMFSNYEKIILMTSAGATDIKTSYHCIDI